ncbi:MAPEG family protein [Sphingomonas baiyangensis]|uniref:MAPEG family protein n=1 Tax=Sphingomonas baiyangensis TaxID=2572576 RepID=A0A4U1L5B2_9SPHN|nr:MAPEG family protein [Sphingomonas baiyangensis]TKD51473.1 MAPEG family protein [Sphingomonas baiyangensis]
MDVVMEQRLVRRGAVLAFVLTVAVCTASLLLLPRLMALPSEIAPRLALAIQTSVPHLLCVLVAIQLVSSGRYRSAADIAGAAAGPPSPQLAVKVAFLQNTLEQAFVGVCMNLALASVTGGSVLALLIASAILFPIGRLLFYRGYPGGAGSRALGMALTALPSLACLGAAGVVTIAKLVGA